MELLADKGNGNYAYIDSLARRVKRCCSTDGSPLSSIAKDVKIRSSFNPTVVAGYRLDRLREPLLRSQALNDDQRTRARSVRPFLTALYESCPPA